MNIDEIIEGLQRAIDELKEEREYLISLEEQVRSKITQAEMWFAEHADTLPEKGGGEKWDGFF